MPALRGCVWLALAGGAAAGCGGDGQFSTPPAPARACEARFLTYGGRCGDEADAQRYNEATGAPETFDAWKLERCFDDSPDELYLEYVNTSDLGFGRGLHMTRCNGRISSYVSNYGSAGQPTADGLHALKAEASKVAVAMDFDPDRGAGYEVQFYIYKEERLAPSLSLDSEGEKFTPHPCTACHGGRFDGGLVEGASFLPILKSSVYFTAAMSSNSEETLRRMNERVYETVEQDPTPAAGIRMLVDTAYPEGVHTLGALYDAGAIPEPWKGKATLYTALIAPFCIGCHAAHQGQAFTSPDRIPQSLIKRVACDGRDMPQAEQMRVDLNGRKEVITLACATEDPQ